MPKTDIKRIVKAGAEMKFANIDYTAKENKSQLKAMKKHQDAIRKREEVNWQQLSNFVVKM